MCKLVLEPFLCCWLLWCWKTFCLSCFLLLLAIICDVLVVGCCLLEVGWSCPLLVECCFSLCCAIVIYSVPWCSIGWPHHCCSFCCEPCDVWAIVCLLWNVEVMSWFDMCPLPQVSFFDPVVSCWWYWPWMWYRCWSSCSCWIKRWLLSCVSHPSCSEFGCLCWCWDGCCWSCCPCCWQCWHWWCVARERCSSFDPEPGLSCPRFSFKDSLLLLSVKCLVRILNVLIVASVSSYNCFSIVLQPFCWNWTPLVWDEECFALCSVHSHQVSLVVECPEVISVPQDLHTCWCQGDWCDLCFCAFGRFMYFQLHVDWNVDKLHRHEVESITLNKSLVESLCGCVWEPF